METPINYKTAIKEIEEIVSQLEDNTLDIDDLSEKVKRVSTLISFCKSKLKTTEEEVAKILESIEV